MTIMASLTQNLPRPISLFILGGARSGKSAYGLGRAQAHWQSGGRVCMVLTARVGDDEMAARIARHRQDRSVFLSAADVRDALRWRAMEVPFALEEALAAQVDDDTLVVVDCLTMWLTNIMLAGENVQARSEALANAVKTFKPHIILVSNEVGNGIVPAHPLGRRFRDAQGALNQAIAHVASDVAFMVAGLPLWLKQRAA